MMNEQDPIQNEKAFRIASLLAAYVNQTLTEAEEAELNTWLNESEQNRNMLETLTNEKNLEQDMDWLHQVHTGPALKKTMEQLSFKPAKPARIITLKPLIAAACLLTVIAFLAYFLTRKKTTGHPTENNPAIADIQPGGNRATLTLGNGTVVMLEDQASGPISKTQPEHGLIREISGGELIYRPMPGSSINTFNTLETPPGGQYRITLPDGSRIMLNAGSTLRYPVQFNSSQRTVQLTGEAFFEIAHDPEKPFIVQLPGGEEVKVLGTQFNISAYPEEKTKNITLTKGSVDVVSSKSRVRLKPGQQSIISNETIIKKDIKDLDEVTGWKDGEFVFRDAGIAEIMKQVERWYNVEVKFETTSSEHFNAIISRNEPVSKLLRYLELTGAIHFKIENRTIYVLP